ncbi:MAG TPA: major capsid protein [Trichocoleus sp.]
MATTSIADIIVPEIWVPYMQERTAQKSALFQSGIIEQSETYDALITKGANTANMPFFKDLSGRSQGLSEDTPLNPKKIGTGGDVCVIQRRGDAWSSSDLAKALSGADPAGAIADLVADYWVRDMQTTLLCILKGVFGSTAMAAEHVRNLAIEDGAAATDANLISSGGVLDAFKLMGDKLDAFAGIAMHGDIYWELEKQDVIEFLAPSGQNDQPIRTYKGKTVIVDDTMPKVAGGTSGFKYTTYLFGMDTIAYGEGTPMGEFGEDISVETDRDILAGKGYLTNRRHFTMHPKGVKWKGTLAGATPTDAELEAAASWERVFERKNVPIAALVTNG